MKQANAWGYKPKQSNTHNRVVIRDGGTLELTDPGPDPQNPYGEFSLSNFASNVIHQGVGLGNFTLVNETDLPLNEMKQTYDEVEGTLTLTLSYKYSLIMLR